MHARIAVLADYTSVSSGNKLNILGIFSNLMAASEPIVHPQMQLVVQFEFDASEIGIKQVRTALVDGDGREILAAQGQVMVPRPAPGELALINHIIVFNNTSLPHFGRYEFRVQVDGRTEAEVPLHVMRAPAPSERMQA